MMNRPQTYLTGALAKGWRMTPRCVMSLVLAGIMCLLLLAPVVAEEGGDGPAGSGLPVPRFVSLKSGKVNLRRGPGTSYPVDWVFERRKMPVEVIAESDRWRKIRDREGDVGWVWHSMLDGRRSAIVAGQAGEKPRAIRAEADPSAPVVAYAEPGVIAELKKCDGSWCAVEAEGYKGYMLRTEIWGTYPNENFN